MQWTAVNRITKKFDNVWKQVSQKAYTWQPVVNVWLVQNISLVFSPTIIMVVKLLSLIKLAESNGKHQQPNPIRKKGYGWK